MHCHSCPPSAWEARMKQGRLLVHPSLVHVWSATKEESPHQPVLSVTFKACGRVVLGELKYGTIWYV